MLAPPVDDLVPLALWTAVQLADVSNFRRLFQRATGVTPSEYRSRCGIAARAADRRTCRRVSRRGSAPLPPDSS
ncbi:AraC family transcriptional regulator [Streptomyces sp. PmtG]